MSTLIELALKSDEVIEVLEHYELTVVYDFDRLNENSPDAYWASSQQAGFELRFNERQVLKTVFVYALSSGEFAQADQGIAGVPFYRTFTEASAAFRAKAISFRTSANGQAWIKGNFEEYTVHYEFNPHGDLALVTMSATDA
ncbi:MAG: hypothetical protein M3R45_04675 [Pseudomonadota bacterium]|nr:hypothetical protein [Pseudomonadota bacterium]